MKIKFIGKAELKDNCIHIPLIISTKNYARSVLCGTDLDFNDWATQKNEPIETSIGEGVIWIFKDCALEISCEERCRHSADEITNHIKHFVYKRESKFEKIRKEVERFERFEKINPAYREQIPEDVRMYVWRRDNGKCVLCNNNKNLEFDHIIPVSKGGGNTERNIQLLCSDCNKKKLDKI